METKQSNSEFNFVFWIHILLVLIAWVGPFLMPWQLMIPGYAVVVLQFILINRCVMNRWHGLEEDEKTTFYSDVFKHFGVNLETRPVRMFIRRFLYPLLALFTWYWQVYSQHQPLLFHF